MPGASRPFGFARVSPDTFESGIPVPGAWEHNGGYYYTGTEFSDVAVEITLLHFSFGFLLALAILRGF